MATLSILQFPDKRLQMVAQPITSITNEVIQIADNMLETMYAAKGVGLAAIQVNIQQRIIVIDVTEERQSPIILFNPEIV